MKQKIKRLFLPPLVALLMLGVASPALSICQKAGIATAVGNIDWNNALPIHVMGLKIGGNADPPRMRMNPICICPSRILGGIPMPGIGLTYWAPLYFVDVTNEAGCFITLGLEMLESYSGQNSGEGNTASASRSGVRRQVHMWEFPLFSILEMFASIGCSAGNYMGYDLAYLTEIDPLWQNDLWSSVLFPGGSLVANVGSRLACVVEAINVQYRFPIDPLWWCLGANHMYPVTGNSQSTAAGEDLNMKILGRFLFHQHRIFALVTSIGAAAQCSSVFTGQLPKSQYRIDPVFPFASDTSRPIVLGRKYLFWDFPTNIINYPSHESSAYMIWRGTQCCIRL